MHCLMLHGFRFVFPAQGNYMCNRYKIENKRSLSRIELRIKFRKTENKRSPNTTQHGMVCLRKRLYARNKTN